MFELALSVSVFIELWLLSLFLGGDGSMLAFRGTWAIFDLPATFEPMLVAVCILEEI